MPALRVPFTMIEADEPITYYVDCDSSMTTSVSAIMHAANVLPGHHLQLETRNAVRKLDPRESVTLDPSGFTTFIATPNTR